VGRTKAPPAATPVTTGVVFDVRRFSVHDGPGIRTTVFLKGCPLRCAWCHNPEGLSAAPEVVWRGERCIRCGTCIATCPEEALAWTGEAPVLDGTRCTLCGDCADVCYADAREVLGRTMTVDDVLAAVERDRPFYEESGGGVTVSGGEPLAQPAFLVELLAQCRARDLHTVLDTSGYAPWTVLDAVRGDVALFHYDLKLIDDARHRVVTGVSNVLILENLARLAAEGHDVVVRLPLVPGVNDDDGNLLATGRLAVELGIRRIDVLPYHRLGGDKYGRLGRDSTMPETETPSRAQVEAAVGTLRDCGLTVATTG